MRRGNSKGFLTTKKPSVCRFSFLLAVTLAVAAPSRAWAQKAAADTSSVMLTEADAVRRAVRRAPLTDALAGAVDVERGAAATLSAYPNPQISYFREQTFGAFGTGEDYLALSQVIDLGNRRGLRGEASEHRARAVEREGDATRAQVAAETRLRFFDVLFRQRRVATLRAWIGRIDGALAIVSRRAARGDAAIYDRRRLEREKTVAQSRLEVEDAALERARVRLAAIVGLPNDQAPRLTVSGDPLPGGEPAPVSSLRASTARRPDLLALDERVRAAELDRSSADRWWLPDLRLEGGWKGVDLGSQGRSDGFIAGVALTLPTWDQSGGLAQVAAGEARAARGRRQLLESELVGEVAGLRADATRLSRAAERFREDSSTVSADLVRIASAGYEGGEMTILQLLDAFRGAADDELAAVDLEQASRRARIELDRAAGTEVP